jgi:hypothetical protein
LALVLTSKEVLELVEEVAVVLAILSSSGGTLEQVLELSEEVLVLVLVLVLGSSAEQRCQELSWLDLRGVGAAEEKSGHDSLPPGESWCHCEIVFVCVCVCVCVCGKNDTGAVEVQ